MKVNGMMIENIVTASREMPVDEVIGILHNKHIGSVLIIDEDHKCEGIFTERDAIRVIATGIPLNTPLKNVMTKNPVTIREGATYTEARRMMNASHIRHLPVVDEQGHVLGLLSLRVILDEFHHIHTVSG